MAPVAGGVHPGVQVYVPDDTHVWILGQVTDVNAQSCSVMLENNEEKTFRLDEVLPSPQNNLGDICSLTELSPIHQASVLACLEQRYQQDQFYTNAGSTIVAVNPFKSVPELYSVDTVFTYHKGEQTDPHIYKVGSEAYLRMCRGLGHGDQCIIVSGESGSGKTVSAKHLLRYMTLVANNTDGETDQSTRRSLLGQSVERRILDSNPVLEAFGNAVTQRNDNSSRFGKYIQLRFSRCGKLEGGEINTYLLEKTRVVHQAPGEANFHIFYQVVRSVLESPDAPLCQTVKNLGSDGFKLLPPSKSLNSNRDLPKTLKAMTEIGLTEETQTNIMKILMAILFLGNVDITAVEEELCQLVADPVSQSSLCQCADLLGIEPSSVEQMLLYRSIQSGGRSRRSVFVKPVPRREACSRRDCLATLLYASLFDWLVSFINEQIQADSSTCRIGLLDIYGFEAFETNSLEQLCINYANEKLQQHYVQHFLRDLQREYEEERINWQFLSYTDNQQCLNLLEGVPPCVFGILDEDVQLNRQTDTRMLCERILELSRCPGSHIKKPRHYMACPSFTVCHYAGNVTYNVDGLTVKNKDNIPLEIVNLLKTSSNSLVSQLFLDYENDNSKGPKRKTVLGKFKQSLDSLMSSLRSSDVHYIRCIKPNRDAVPALFTRRFVMDQLLANGIIETVRISCHGYPIRMPYTDFLHRYGLIIRNARTPPTSDSEVGQGARSDCDSLYEPLELLYRKQLDMLSGSPRKNGTPRKRLRRRAGLSSADHTRRCCAAVLSLQFRHQDQGLTQQFGKTKLFLHQHQVDALEQTKFDILSMKARVIQRRWRHCLHQRELQRQRLRHDAANKIQRVWRGYWRRRREKAVLMLQKSFRFHCARLRFRKQLEKLRNEKKNKKKSWKPLIVNRRTSGDSQRSRPSSRSSAGSPSARSDSSTSSLTQSENSYSDLRDASKEVILPQQHGGLTSTPRSKFNKSDNVKDSGSLKRQSNLNERPFVSDGLSLVNPDSKRTGEPFTSLENTRSDNHGNVRLSPRKKRKTADGFVVTLDDLRLGDGIVTRRRLPKVAVRFHTRPSVLKNAHLLPKKETMCGGLLDLLQDNQSNQSPSKSDHS